MHKLSVEFNETTLTEFHSIYNGKYNDILYYF